VDEERTLRSHDGLDLAVRAYGEGDAVVLLHGATLDAAWNWERPGIAAAIVDAGHRVVLPDLRGHGASAKPLDANGYALESLTRDVELVLDAFGLERAVLVGYSLGSVIALHAATRDGRVTAVVAGGLALEIVDPEPITPELESRARQHPPERAALIRGLRLPRIVDYAAVRVPTLVVNGGDDLPPHSLVAALPNATAATVAGDHVTAVDDPAFVAAILELLRRR
jgi:pimeloyl-ACP methyl ester carboxylesterase